MPNGDDIGGLNKACETGPLGGVAACKQEKHWIRVILCYKDDKSKVKAAKCTLSKGGAVKAPGPLANGQYYVPVIDPGTYDISFPEIDASEWEPE
jgi:hypothetical protein